MEFKTSWKDITEESGSHHDNVDNNANGSKKSTRRTVATIVDTTTHMNIDDDKEEGSTVSMKITEDSTVVNVTHDMLNTSES